MIKAIIKERELPTKCYTNGINKFKPNLSLQLTGKIENINEFNTLQMGIEKSTRYLKFADIPDSLAIHEASEKEINEAQFETSEETYIKGKVDQDEFTATYQFKRKYSKYLLDSPKEGYFVRYIEVIEFSDFTFKGNQLFQENMLDYFSTHDYVKNILFPNHKENNYFFKGIKENANLKPNGYNLIDNN